LKVAHISCFIAGKQRPKCGACPQTRQKLYNAPKPDVPAPFRSIIQPSRSLALALVALGIFFSLFPAAPCFKACKRRNSS
jgi:hypothetical protein